MSKLSPTGQSMAALFSPEGERLRSNQKDKASSAGPANGSFQIRGANALDPSQKSQDSLGNPASPGYERLGKRKAEEDGNIAPESEAASGFNVPGSSGRQRLRLALGWEQLILAQKKICAKAKGLFTNLEAPGRYKSQKRSSFLEAKSRGSILNLNLVTELPADGKKEEEEEDAA